MKIDILSLGRRRGLLHHARERRIFQNGTNLNLKGKQPLGVWQSESITARGLSKSWNEFLSSFFFSLCKNCPGRMKCVCALTLGRLFQNVHVGSRYRARSATLGSSFRRACSRDRQRPKTCAFFFQAVFFSHSLSKVASGSKGRAKGRDEIPTGQRANRSIHRSETQRSLLSLQNSKGTLSESQRSELKGQSLPLKVSFES